MLNLTTENQFNYWHDHVAAFVASGETQKDYCKINNLSHSAFKKWRYKLSAEFPVNNFHPRAITNKIKSAKIRVSSLSGSQLKLKLLNMFVLNMPATAAKKALKLRQHLSYQFQKV